jgi:hypothetical protein
MPSTPRKAAPAKKAAPKKAAPRRTRSQILAAMQTDENVSKIVAGQGDAKYAPTTWSHSGPSQFDLQVPSGQVCLVRRTTLQGMMEAGVLSNVDTLTAIVNSKYISQSAKKAQPKVDVGELMKDPDELKNVLSVMDDIVCYVVQQPPVQPVPKDEKGNPAPTEKINGLVYVDDVDLMDKMFIFQYVLGGTKDLEQFRNETEVHVGSVDAEQAVEL